MAKVSQQGHGWPIFDFKAIIAGYDYAALSQTSTTDVYTYRQGGASGTVLATLTITYTDSTKATISNWTIA